MLLEIIAMVLVVGFALIAAIGHVLIVQAILAARRTRQPPPNAPKPAEDSAPLPPPAATTLENQHAA